MACEKFGIDITAKEARPYVNSFLHHQGVAIKDDDDSPNIPYSNEAFANAIAEWIVADDQIRCCCSKVSISLTKV